MNLDAHAGFDLLGATATFQDVVNSSSPVPTSYEVNIGPQIGASISPEVEFTASGRDVVNAVKDTADRIIE